MSGLKKIVAFLQDRSAATAIEYGLIAGLIALAVIGGATAVGGEANNTFVDVRAGFSAAAP